MHDVFKIEFECTTKLPSGLCKSFSITSRVSLEWSFAHVLVDTQLCNITKLHGFSSTKEFNLSPAFNETLSDFKIVETSALKRSNLCR